MDQLSTDLPSNYNIDDLGHDNNKNIDQETQELNVNLNRSSLEKGFLNLFL